LPHCAKYPNVNFHSITEWALKKSLEVELEGNSAGSSLALLSSWTIEINLFAID
jgi:hypothetical protein